ncbi:Predicted thiol-disulfide oxidoreductase YuxK, DCC family [Thermoactinomyces sp. DSM 45891]|uniref:thiol-disulfide oxidoreductase DCC family protein n=1 Tax=Thermoactinomyces sp. DSM 45891 TaxID=1761907 RepID=UPI00091D6609|nr:DCC1-like thiol-disulfide oxidoreductase family protein [Thermoactinomyces sp. DSM 45891]SFW98056.1 Predicted thiol-disulfide oxidoreductase YuxK, DCC family [Thermoactinomyces sp. DSM 45891]
MKQKIVLFDGVCNFCNGRVQFLLKHDKKKQLHFAPLQSNFVQNWVAEKGIQLEDSMYFIDGDTLYSHSTAVLRIIKELGGCWRWLYILILVPESIRNTLYRRFAKNRYRWFGKSEVCLIPSPEARNRFYL